VRFPQVTPPSNGWGVFLGFYVTKNVFQTRFFLDVEWFEAPESKGLLLEMIPCCSHL